MEGKDRRKKKKPSSVTLSKKGTPKTTLKKHPNGNEIRILINQGG